MSYNLLLDTQFKESNWRYINCERVGEKVVSKGKVFGIEQELILPDPTHLYFRCEYLSLTSNIYNVKIGIQNGDVLNVNIKTPRWNKWQSISVVENANQEKIKLHIIFESNTEENEVEIRKPLLVDLNYMKRSTWIKWMLDKTIKYRDGYTYENIYKDRELKPSISDFIGIESENAKIGSIIKVKEPITIKINAKFIRDRYYLIKLDYEEINKFGKVYLEYGVVQSVYYGEEQLYLIIKWNGELPLYLKLECNDIIDYMINLKHLLIVDITKMKLAKEDIPYLPFL